MTSRPGIALVSALSLIALLGLLLVGAVSGAVMRQRAEGTAAIGPLLDAANDDAISSYAVSADGAGLADLSLGAATPLPTVLNPDGRVVTTITAARLSGGTVWLVAESMYLADSTLRRRTNLVLRFPLAGPSPPAAIVARGAVTLAPDVVLTRDTTGGPECVATGSSVRQTADSATLYLMPAQLAAIDSGPGVLHIRRDTTLGAGSIEGVVRVDGDLRVDGSLSVTGLLIVGGSIRSTGALRVTGALVTQAGDVDLAAAEIRFSPCAATRALRRAAPPRPVRGRRWAELF